MSFWSIPAALSNDAKEESVNTILEMAEYKEERNLQGALIVSRLSGTALQGGDHGGDSGGGRVFSERPPMTRSARC